MEKALPAPSLRELARPKGVTEGVYFDERNRSKISEPIRSGSQTISPNQPTNDTPSASLRSAAPSKREPGMGRTIQYIAQKPQHYGRFSSPLRNSKVFTFHHSTDDTPSVSHSLDSSLREGAGVGGVPFNGVLAKIPGCGRFSSPLRNSEDITFHDSSKSKNCFNFLLDLLDKMEKIR